eukprot:1160785-Pelagomonas_calceolata.AAC.2
MAGGMSFLCKVREGAGQGSDAEVHLVSPIIQESDIHGYAGGYNGCRIQEEVDRCPSCLGQGAPSPSRRGGGEEDRLKKWGKRVQFADNCDMGESHVMFAWAWQTNTRTVRGCKVHYFYGLPKHRRGGEREGRKEAGPGLSREGPTTHTHNQHAIPTSHHSASIAEAQHATAIKLSLEGPLSGFFCFACYLFQMPRPPWPWLPRPAWCVKNCWVHRLQPPSP